MVQDGSCKIVIGSSNTGETVSAFPNEIEMVVPRKSDKIKIMGGAREGATGKLIGVKGTDGIVKVDETHYMMKNICILYVPCMLQALNMY